MELHCDVPCEHGTSKLQQMEIGPLTMRRFSYYLLLIVSVTAAAVAGFHYVGRVQAGQGGSQAALSDLLWIVGIALGIFLTRRGMQTTRMPITKNSQEIVDRSSVISTLRTLPAGVRLAYSRRPLLATILTLFVIAVPVGMTTLITPGGVSGIDSKRWLLVGITETPAALIAVLVALSFLSKK